MTQKNNSFNLESLFHSYFSGAQYQVAETKERKELVITALTPTMAWYLPALKINLNKALEVYSQDQELEFSRENDAPVCWISYGQTILDDKISARRIKRGLENHLLAIMTLKETSSIPDSTVTQLNDAKIAVKKSIDTLNRRLIRHYDQLGYSIEDEKQNTDLVLTAYQRVQGFYRPALILNLTRLCEKYARNKDVNLLINGRNEPTQWITLNGVIDQRSLVFAEKAPSIFVEYFKALGEDYSRLAQDVENESGKMGGMGVIDNLFEYKAEKKEQKMDDNGVIPKPTLIYKPTKRKEDEIIVNWGLGKGVNLDTMDSAYFSRRMQEYFKIGNVK